jgi:endo-1,4-beta-xylanase
MNRFLVRLALASIFAQFGLPLVGAEVRTISIPSPSNGGELLFAIYLPPQYEANPSQRFPTVYCLHGLSGNPISRSRQVVPALDSAIASGAVQPMIYVFPDGQRNSFYADAFDKHKRVHANLIDEVIPYVDQNFRTQPGRSSRAIEGFSMGGYGAAMLAAKHPELFGAVVEYAGALAEWPDLLPATKHEMFNDDLENFKPFSVWELSKKNADDLAQLEYLIVVGDQDQEFQDNVRFHQFLSSLGIKHQFVVLPGFGHYGPRYAEEGTGTRFLSKFFQKATHH